MLRHLIAFALIAFISLNIVDAQKQFQLVSNDLQLVFTLSTSGSLYASSLLVNRNLSTVFTKKSGYFNSLLHTSSETSFSSTSLLVDGTWYGPWINSSSRIIQYTSSNFVVDVFIGPTAAPYASERWSVTLLKDGALNWNVKRTYLQAISLTADRAPGLSFDTSVGIPGFFDPTVFLNGSSFAGFDLFYANEMLSAQLTQEVRVAPLGVLFRSRMTSFTSTTTPFFSFSKFFADGTSEYVTIGLETVDRRLGLHTTYAGENFEVDWDIKFAKDDGGAYGTPLSLSIPKDPLTAELSARTVNIHNHYQGFLFGNNPASVVCLHEMAWFSMIQGVFLPNEQSLSHKLALRFLSNGVDASGLPFPRWNLAGFYADPWGPARDQVPHFILSVYHYIVETGDAEFLAEMTEVMDRVATYMISLDIDNTGTATITEASGLSDGGKHTTNWWDIINFGHKDAYVNVYCVHALQALAELKQWQGDSTKAKYYSDLHVKWLAGFNKVFWDDSQGFYSDWIDVNGVRHNWFYVDHNCYAIIHNYANATQTKRIIARMDLQYQNLFKTFNLTKNSIWATPANLIPITWLGDLVFNGTLGNQKQYPNYENGESFFHSTGYEIAARAYAGDLDGAYAVYTNLLNGSVQQSGGSIMWGAALLWTKQTLMSEPLNNGLLTTWGFLRGCFNVWPSLTGISVGHAAPQLEGAVHQFSYLGKIVTVTVVNGTSVLS